MSSSALIQLVVLAALIAITTPLLGGYLARVFGQRELEVDRAPGDRVFLRIERLIYQISGIDPAREQRWNVYALSLLAFSLLSVLAVYALQRLQGVLPVNPNGFDGVPAPLAWNAAVSFTTNTNWQNYAGETTMSNLVQMTGLAVQNFASAAVGMAVAVALVRGLVRRRAVTIGNFWVDLTRAITRVFLPLSFVIAVIYVSQGILQNLDGGVLANTVEGASQWIPGGPMASQEAIKELGTNGGGFLNANSAHPFENPNGFTNMLQMFTILLIPFALTATFGRMAKDRRQGWVVFAAMFALWFAAAGLAMQWESDGNPLLSDRGADQAITADNTGGNLEGKEIRFGPGVTGIYAATTTGTSTGAVIGMHDSFTPRGGAVPLANMLLGEVSPGGVGAGLYGMLLFALISVFIAGLMVGRTPEYLGKKIQANEMKLAVIYLLAVPLAVLCFTGASVVLGTAQASILNPGPHGLTEVGYAFASAGNNNGSAFGGLTGNTDWYNTTLGLSMLVGRYVLIIAALAIAGSLARKQPVPASSGTFPTGTPLFTGLLLGVVVIVVGLTYFPILSLGPIAEQLSL